MLSLDATEILELHIESTSVRLYPEIRSAILDDNLAVLSMTPGADSPSTSRWICLLQGSVHEFARFSGHQEASKWLIDIAHDICDPADRRGFLVVEQQQWHPVCTTDPLIASIYRYVLPVGITVGLSKISARARKSVTTAHGGPSTMADRVKTRDKLCWVTGFDDPLVNSHICPKRMGDHIGRIVFRTFTSLPLPPNLSIYNEIFGFCLSKTLDAWFDKYDMGFRYVSPNNYECHMFPVEPANVEYTIYGRAPKPRPPHLPVIHGFRVSPPQPELSNSPPSGLFRWHYLQCVIKRFAHEDYKNLKNIKFSELPLRMEGDSDDDDTDLGEL